MSKLAMLAGAIIITVLPLTSSRSAGPIAAALEGGLADRSAIDAHPIPGTSLHATTETQLALADPRRRGTRYVKVFELVGMEYDMQQNLPVPRFREILVPVAESHAR